ncbi:DUF6746 family protein [Thioalkalivibrio sp.]|uniref:DUF6746 family protein n=1 Tax=Thioalkalivibrio sp. TaxID=2093813 RepID=UPI00356197F6
MRLITSLTLAGTLVLALPVLAEDRPDHFQGKPSETVEEALAVLNEHNPRLEVLLAKDTLTPQEVGDVHQLTYTLENALETIANEHERVAELLEEVHLASEANDADTVRRSGREYLERSQKLIP